MRKKKVQSRQRVLDAACKLFAYHGYAATSIQQIVKAAGITRPTLYYYFGSKAGLYQTVIDAAYDERMLLMQKAVNKRHEIKQQLSEILTALFDFARNHRDLMRICFSTVFAAPGELPSNVRFSEKGVRNFEFVHSLIKNGLASGELDLHFNSRELATAIYGQFLIYAIAQIINHRHFHMKPVSERIVELYLKGASKKPSRTSIR